MKKLLILLFGIFLYSCSDSKQGELIEYKPLIILDKCTFSYDGITNYCFKFYLDGELYRVTTNQSFYNSYKEGDTLKGCQLIPR